MSMGLKIEDLKMNKTSPYTQGIYVPPTFYCTVSAVCFLKFLFLIKPFSSQIYFYLTEYTVFSYISL